GLFEGMPDVVGIFLDGLTRAAEDPEVENVIIDLSNNTGGSSDALAFMASIVTGRDFIRYENALTGQVITQHFDVDRNLDGVFDENDALVDYSDLNFAVLTSQSSYSCGNLFPLEMAEDGILLLGERSGGGSCVVEMHVNADGTTFQLSSWRGRLVDADGQDIDTGIPVDIDLVSENGGYENFYNLELLNQLMNEQFGQEELEQAA
ncbi:MAG: hypothetical protein IJ092_07870, partial [Atopobiaceae bacterium]|nr:hypothetical protein [Atopobiaceae bacterium]